MYPLTGAQMIRFGIWRGNSARGGMRSAFRPTSSFAKGDLGRFENLQTEGIYGKRYKLPPENLFAVYPALHRIFLGEKIVQGPGQVKRPGL